MAGTDDRPDDEGPGPDDGSGPDDGPTPDDADPPVPDDDGEPEPDDEGDPPDDAQPDRQRERRSTLELVTVGLTAIAFIVGSVFSYLSVVVSRDSVVVAREALNDSRQVEDEETRKDLSRIKFDIRNDGDRFVLEVQNRSSRPFRPNSLEYFTSPFSEFSGKGFKAFLAFSIDGGVLGSCSTMLLTFDDRASNSEIFEAERSGGYYNRTLIGIDVLSSAPYGLGSFEGAIRVERTALAWNVETEGFLWADASVSDIEDC